MCEISRESKIDKVIDIKKDLYMNLYSNESEMNKVISHITLSSAILGLPKSIKFNRDSMCIEIEMNKEHIDTFDVKVIECVAAEAFQDYFRMHGKNYDVNFTRMFFSIVLKTDNIVLIKL
jgi:hypothetical protein